MPSCQYVTPLMKIIKYVLLSYWIFCLYVNRFSFLFRKKDLFSQGKLDLKLDFKIYILMNILAKILA